MRVDVGPDGRERLLGRRQLVDPDPVGIEEPRNRLVAVAQALDRLRPDALGEPPEREPMHGVDAVEQLEHRPPDRLLEIVDLGEQLLEPS